MTREEERENAIRCLKLWIEREPYLQTYKTCLKVLEQEPCGDCISRQAVLDGLASIAKTKAKSDAQKSLMGRVMFLVEQMPSVQPKTEPEPILDKIDEIIVDELDKSTDQKESQTLRWVLDKISEVT